MNLTRDAIAVQCVIREQPGIASKRAIAVETGLSQSRVATVIRATGSADSRLPPICYGSLELKGELVRGWFVVTGKQYHPLMAQEGEHMVRTLRGVERTRGGDA
jgi:hypothetical protein